MSDAIEHALQIRDNVKQSRFELEVGSHLVVSDYRRHGEVLFID